MLMDSPHFFFSLSSVTKALLRGRSNHSNRMQGESLALKLARYLFHYRITPHSTTGLSPAELLMGHCPRSVLDLVHPDPVQRVENCQQQQLVEQAVCPVR